ncbi:uncharacterized protein V2V93DRAFT_376150 [Kockiozyma suomiensis]|uniref:uncharacterized protein n=1 Tax=Kockiozyma suomiensis TaxID=1337062 RepID=UPI0033442C5E
MYFLQRRTRLVPVLCIVVLLLSMILRKPQQQQQQQHSSDRFGIARFVAAHVFSPSQIEAWLPRTDPQTEAALSLLTDDDSVWIPPEKSSTCSQGDGFMSCRSDEEAPAACDASGLFAVLGEGQYAAELCAETAECALDSACFELGLCLSSKQQHNPISPLQIYKPALVAMPQQPQATHLLSSLLGPSSKTTLLLRAFAKSIYAFNNISDAPLSTFTVVPFTQPTAMSTKTDNESMNEKKSESKSAIITAVKHDSVLPGSPTPHTELSQSSKLQQQQQQQQQQQASLEQQQEPQHSHQFQHKPNKSSDTATRLNVRKVLESTDRRSSSCLGLVVAMLCFVGMGM